MTTQFNHGPTFCADCGGAISAMAVRCRRCAARTRRRPTPVPPARPASSGRRPHGVAWIVDDGRRYNNARLARVPDYAVEEIRAIPNAAVTE